MDTKADWDQFLKNDAEIYATASSLVMDVI